TVPLAACTTTRRWHRRAAHPGKLPSFLSNRLRRPGPMPKQHIMESTLLIHCRRSSRRRHAGGALLEMVLVLPVLLMVSFGIVDYGYFFFVKSTVQSAAQAGARAAIASGAIDSDVTSAVQSAMTSAGISTSSYTLTT